MNIKAIDHFVITTRDLAKCIAFYEGVLGMKHEVIGGQHILQFGKEKINLHTKIGEFTPFAQNASFGSQDFCLIADGDIYAIKRQVERAGCSIIEGVVEQDGAQGLMDSIYFYDPDGNLVEIAVYRKNLEA